jgi:hypothetical protein
MARIPVPLGTSSDGAKRKQGGGATLTNCYIEATTGGKTQYSINCDPGLNVFSESMAIGIGRGGVAFNNNFYAVVGETVYKVASSGVATALGTVLGERHCVFSINRKAPNPQITITADTKNYYIENDVLSEITDLDLPAGVNSNCYLNGRTIYFLNSGVFFYSDNNETSSIGVISFAEAERSSDAGVRVFANGEELWFGGAESMEIWRDTGDAALPFSPLQGAGKGKGYGIGAKHSPALCAGALIWVNDEKNVVRANGYDAVKISDHRVDRDLGNAIAGGLADEIIGFSWDIEGHQFYHIRCSLWCWVYDAAYDSWHRKTDYLQPSWRGSYFVRAFNKNLVGDAENGKIYEYTTDAASEAGDQIIMGITTTPLNAYPDGYICDAFHIDVQSGVGRAGEADHVQTPQALLRVSRDGGMTFDNTQRRSMGAQGKWATQLRFNRLGATNGAGMVFDLSFPEPVDRMVMQAAADVRKLAG